MLLWLLFIKTAKGTPSSAALSTGVKVRKPAIASFAVRLSQDYYYYYYYYDDDEEPEQNSGLTNHDKSFFLAVYGLFSCLDCC